MNYTRRRVLRNAARVSLGLAASSSLAFLNSPPALGAVPNPSQFNFGIRIFFIGAWIFCSDPAGGGMLAVTADFPTPVHDFPYGVWPKLTKSLAPNCSTCMPSTPYPITLPGFTSPHSSITDLFVNGCSTNFNYFDNSANDLSIDRTNKQIRMISLPFPTFMVTADTYTSSYITNADVNHSFHGFSGSGGNVNSNVISTAHILEYDGASALEFNGTRRISAPHPDSRANFHFHTVPPETTPDAMHSLRMFRNLISLIPKLSPDNFTPNFVDTNLQTGSNVPANVGSDELAFPRNIILNGTEAKEAMVPGKQNAKKPNGKPVLLRGTLASCALSGFGVNNPPSS